jgi:hypothetical protein
MAQGVKHLGTRPCIQISLRAKIKLSSNKCRINVKTNLNDHIVETNRTIMKTCIFIDNCFSDAHLFAGGCRDQRYCFTGWFGKWKII